MRFPIARPDLDGNEREYVAQAVAEGQISSVGRFVKSFEAACARAIDVPHAVTVSNGTAALHLTLTALGIGPGDEVIVPDLTYVATANAVTYTGARVVLVDVDPKTWTVDVGLVEKALSRRTKAIIAVHLYGMPADLDGLAQLARRRGVALIEDAAQAFHARWNGRYVGAIGDAACFSFFGNKIVTTGEGGLVTTRSARLAARLYHLRDQAMSSTRRYFHSGVGFNYRMTALQAAVGLAQLERVGEFLARREAIRASYRNWLADVPGLREPAPDPRAHPVTWLYTFQLAAWTRHERDRCMALLQQRGIDSRPGFVPMSRLPMYRRPGYRVAERISAQSLSLPTHTGMSDDDVRIIAEAFKEVAQQPQGCGKMLG